MHYKTSISYYGGKSKIAHLYPSPDYKQIIEPFCGSASYAVRYSTHNVWINDLNEDTFHMWEFLISPHAEADIKRFVPEAIPTGLTIGELVPKDAPYGLQLIMHYQAVHGTGGTKRRPEHNQVARFGVVRWPVVRPRLLWIAARVKHWKVTNLDYRDLPNVEATWFVDPPYNNKAGNVYAIGGDTIDFVELGKWCMERTGNIIVCENEGADWLPFVRLCDHAGLHHIADDPSDKAMLGEVVYMTHRNQLPI